VNSKSCRNSLKHSGVAGGKGGGQEEARARGESAHFLQSFKTRFKQKFRPKDA